MVPACPGRGRAGGSRSERPAHRPPLAGLAAPRLAAQLDRHLRGGVASPGGIAFGGPFLLDPGIAHRRPPVLRSQRIQVLLVVSGFAFRSSPARPGGAGPAADQGLPGSQSDSSPGREDGAADRRDRRARRRQGHRMLDAPLPTPECWSAPETAALWSRQVGGPYPEFRAGTAAGSPSTS